MSCNEVIIEDEVFEVVVEDETLELVIEEEVLQVVVEDQVQELVIEDQVFEIVIESVGMTGPQGEKGDSGDLEEIYSMNAGENILSLKAVRRESDGLGYLADSSDVTHANSVIGISTQSANSGGVFNFVARGELTDPSFSFVDGPIYVGLTGNLTQSPPSSGFSRKLGHAIGNTTIFVDIGTPIILT